MFQDKDADHEWADCPYFNTRSKAYKERIAKEEKDSNVMQDNASYSGSDREIEDRDDL